MNRTIDLRDLHKKADILKTLCLRADGALEVENGTPVFEEWKKLDGFHETRTNFKGVLYSDGKEYVICYCGTERRNIKDYIENIVMGLFGKSLQMRIANYYYKKCKEDFGFYNGDLTLAGHSEGGTEATYVGIKNRVKAVTFNSFGLSRRQYDGNVDYSDLITNYRSPSDPVSKLKENPGRTYIVPAVSGQCPARRIFAFVKAHMLASFGNCEDAVPVEEYMDAHPFFINSYKLLKKL